MPDFHRMNRMSVIEYCLLDVMLHHQQHHLQRVLPAMIAVTLIVFDDNDVIVLA